jgi:hypothetical protein
MGGFADNKTKQNSLCIDPLVVRAHMQKAVQQLHELHEIQNSLKNRALRDHHPDLMDIMLQERG